MKRFKIGFVLLEAGCEFVTMRVKGRKRLNTEGACLSPLTCSDVVFLDYRLKMAFITLPPDYLEDVWRQIKGASSGMNLHQPICVMQSPIYI